MNVTKLCDFFRRFGIDQELDEERIRNEFLEEANRKLVSTMNTQDRIAAVREAKVVELEERLVTAEERATVLETMRDDALNVVRNMGVNEYDITDSAVYRVNDDITALESILSPRTYI